MFKLGSILLFITFAQIIGVTICMQFYLNKSDELFIHTPGLIVLIILVELIYSIRLILKGYGTLKNKR
ncbi:hypothetical protein L323_17485 [Ruminiclostridium papyrosolvens C7]|uniref:Uncharacterized protein n=1 Tax=Ruminiclostridium papyrosolvens C7 TaxID=1330534 RepID=U4QXY2_9FIRM|nr:hypothetical protein L323_17485 [Ruminiclostridium papyrosolvens C7]